jgi:dolichol-phosphate mannosyltransferase
MKSKRRYLIQICTYNEVKNLPKLLPILEEKYGAIADLLVIDDNSPDGTSDWTEAYAKDHPIVSLMRRTEDRGRGRASRAGYQAFMSSTYEYLIEIDADLSHDPSDIGRLMAQKEDADILIGSRYADGASFGNYKWYRKALSRCGNFVLRSILGLKVRDASQSFQLIPRRIFERVNPLLLESPHFSIFMELKCRASRAGFKLKEIPIKIIDRTEGESKLHFGQQVRSVLWMIYILRIREPLPFRSKRIAHDSMVA